MQNTRARSYNATVRKLASVGALALVLIHAQYRELLLPEARTISGLAVDPDGKPISGVRVDHHGNMRQTVSTDPEGRFQLQTKAPAIVLRKTGYRSRFIRTPAAAQVRIVLEPVGSAEMPKFCSAASQCESIVGWQAEFCFPKVVGVEASPQGRDADYGIRSYIVKTGSGPVGIRHGSGPMWSFGMPVDTDVWKSVEYTEATYVQDELVILDARGRTASGKRWRYLGRFGESASYSDVDEDTSRILDRMLDGMCVRR